jgi:hypothetical protein
MSTPSSFEATEEATLLGAKRKSSLDPPSAKRPRSPILPLVRSPRVRHMMSQVSSPSVRSPMAIINSSRQRTPSPAPTSNDIDMTNQTRATPCGSHATGRARKLKSTMWKEFDPIRTNDKLSHAKCIHCNKVFVASRSSGTS